MLECTPTRSVSKKQLEADTDLVDQSKMEPNPEDYYSNLLAATKKTDRLARIIIVIVISSHLGRSRAQCNLQPSWGQAPAAIDRAQQSTDAAAAHHSPTRRDLDSTTAHSPRPWPTVHRRRRRTPGPARRAPCPLLRSIHSHPSARPCPSGQMPGRASQIHSIHQGFLRLPASFPHQLFLRPHREFVPACLTLTRHR
jgi:hypothetical protein